MCNGFTEYRMRREIEDVLKQFCILGTLRSVCTMLYWRVMRDYELSGSHGGQKEDDSFLRYSAV
jgi:hypothetical protein